MLRSIANFFQKSSDEDHKSNLIFPKTLLNELNAEILYRQKFFIMCTAFTGLFTIGSTLASTLLLFKYLHEKVNALSYDNIDWENLESVADYYGYKASLYGFLPVGGLITLGIEIKYFYNELKKFYHYAENTSVSELSPKLFDKIKDYLKTIQYNADYLTIEDVQEILIQESHKNCINETQGIYYAI
jgi:hypothetical protein